MTAHSSIAIIGRPPDSFNLAAYVLAQATATPDKAALVSDDGASLSYAGLRQAVVRTGAGLLDQGWTAGDRVVMRLGNSRDFPIVFLGAIYAGLVPIPTSAMLTTTEVTAIVADTRPVGIVAHEGLALPEQPLPVISPDALAGSTDSMAPRLGPPDRPAYIIYTSGTSGTPRAVVHAHRAIWARRMMWEGWYGLRPNDVLLHAGAFNWTYTLGTGLMDPWACGATAVIPSDGTTADHLPALLARHDATIFAAAPGVYRRLLRSETPTLPSLRHGLSAGEKLPPTIAAAWTKATGTPLLEAYGMSECSTFISSSPSRRTDGLGWPQPGRQVALLSPDGPVPDGTPGQIAVHRDDPGLMLGYLDQSAETATRFQGDWFLTGDIGTRGPDGAIHYAGRVDDMMNAGGYRVSPIEVETALARHPAITEVACCEIKVAPETSVIAAFYVASDLIEETDLTAFAGQTLAHYKVPRMFHHIPALPRGANNKILRQKLRRDWEASHGQT